MIRRKGRACAATASSICVAGLLAGCYDVPVLQPKGPVGTAEEYIIGIALGLMLIVVIPAIFLSVWFARRYRASRPRGDYAPGWTYSLRIDLIIWLVPMAIVTALGTVAWKGSHLLDPGKPIVNGHKPLLVQVIALDWKWLFIYPQQDVASVNQLALPVDTPIKFNLTSDSVINSFFIPQLGGQVYAMAGRKSTLHLLAQVPGVYFGESEQFSGGGYADMHFAVRVTGADGFRRWVAQVKRAAQHLDLAHFQHLRKPSFGYPVTHYAGVDLPLFRDIVDQYRTVKGLSADGKPKEGDRKDSGGHD